MRKILSILFGALPATWLMIPASMLLAYGIGEKQILAIFVGVTAFLGTIGIWKVSLSTNYKTNTNAFLLACGVISLFTVRVSSAIAGEEWFSLKNISKNDLVSLLLMLSPFVVTMSYLGKINNKNKQLIG